MVKYILDSRPWCVEEEDNDFKADLGHSNETLSQTWKGQVKTRHSSWASPRTVCEWPASMRSGAHRHPLVIRDEPVSERHVTPTRAASFVCFLNGDCWHSPGTNTEWCSWTQLASSSESYINSTRAPTRPLLLTFWRVGNIRSENGCLGAEVHHSVTERSGGVEAPWMAFSWRAGETLLSHMTEYYFTLKTSYQVGKRHHTTVVYVFEMSRTGCAWWLTLLPSTQAWNKKCSWVQGQLGCRLRSWLKKRKEKRSSRSGEGRGKESKKLMKCFMGQLMKVETSLGCRSWGMKGTNWLPRPLVSLGG